jgi:hypothetical protein
MFDTSGDASPRRRAPIRTRWLALCVIFAFLLIGAGCYRYWVKWQDNRPERYRNGVVLVNVLHGFITDIKQGRWDKAYESTTPAFQRLVSREVFDERARICLEFHGKPDARGVAGPVDKHYRSKEVVKDTYTLQDAEGNRVEVSTKVVLEDSIFYLHPPSPRVDDFFVKQVSGAAGYSDASE